MRPQTCPSWHGATGLQLPCSIRAAQRRRALQLGLTFRHLPHALTHSIIMFCVSTIPVKWSTQPAAGCALHGGGGPGDRPQAPLTHLRHGCAGARGLEPGEAAADADLGRRRNVQPPGHLQEPRQHQGDAGDGPDSVRLRGGPLRDLPRRRRQPGRPRHHRRHRAGGPNLPSSPRPDPPCLAPTPWAAPHMHGNPPTIRKAACCPTSETRSKDLHRPRWTPVACAPLAKHCTPGLRLESHVGAMNVTQCWTRPWCAAGDADAEQEHAEARPFHGV